MHAIEFMRTQSVIGHGFLDFQGIFYAFVACDSRTQEGALCIKYTKKLSFLTYFSDFLPSFQKNVPFFLKIAPMPAFSRICPGWDSSFPKIILFTIFVSLNSIFQAGEFIHSQSYSISCFKDYVRHFFS